MYGLLCRNGFKGMVLFFCVPWVLLGCGSFDADGSGDSGSLFNIDQIDPTYFDESTRQVDVVQVNCAPPDEDPDAEPYTDHLSDVTLSNRPLNNSIVQTASRIRVQSYQVWYTPLTQGSPALASFTISTIGDGYALDPCIPGSDCQGETVSQIEFVPVRLKDVLREYILATGIFQLEYIIHYRFFGVNDYGYPVSAESSTNFYAANYDNCGGG